MILFKLVSVKLWCRFAVGLGGKCRSEVLAEINNNNNNNNNNNKMYEIVNMNFLGKVDLFLV